MSKLEGLTLSLDIGGSGIKGMVLNPDGEPVSKRQRVVTPRPATPEAVLGAIEELIGRQPHFDRIAVGFPGVVEFGVVYTGANFDGDWSAVPLAAEIERRTGKPCRAANDADIQGYGAIEGKGVEMVITLGTGMGSAVFSNGHLVPNLELGHHPLADGQTYEERVGASARKALGDKQWTLNVLHALEQIQPIWNPRMIYLGGGNTKHLDTELPARVRIVPNVAGILGGIRLWQDEGH